MPTGYTAAIADGISFKEYALGCARAFGATIMMRDEPASAPIPDEFQPSDYHSKKLTELGSELIALLAMDSKSATAHAKAAHEKHVAYHMEGIAKAKDLENKYAVMLKHAQEYVSPSTEHDNFKAFMISQIQESIRFDCGGEYHKNAIDSARLLSGAEWLVCEKARIENDMEYHRAEHQKEIERANSRTGWIQKLKASLA